MEYKVYSFKNLNKIKHIERLSKSEKFNIEVVSQVLPFKTNNYVTDELIDWDNYENDPMYILNFPGKGMLKSRHFNRMAETIVSGKKPEEIRCQADSIRMELNPHPAGQIEHNTPEIHGEKLMGLQHKYKQTVLFFPSSGQTCHAYCTFCFRWPQFSGLDNIRFAMKQADAMITYLEKHPEVTDILITGGDPMVMGAKRLGIYLDAILEAKLPRIRNIRIGTKSLSFWPYRYLTDRDSKEILNLFRKVTDSGIHLAIMAHFNHYRELTTDAVKEAICKIQATGAVIRSQSPILNHINNDPEIWSKMWNIQVNLGIVPYYMFIPRNTGAQDYFAVPLVDAYKVFTEAYTNVSGIARTVRGPSMSANPGKIKVDGITEINGKKRIGLSFIQGRNPDWVNKPFFAQFDDKAVWIDDLKPAFEEQFFFMA